jgi:hypothetical protein
MNTHPGATLAASLLALVFAALIWTVGRQRWPRTVVALIVAGVGGLTNTTAGAYARRGVDAGEAALGHLLGTLFGYAFPGIVAIVAIAVVGFHWHHKTISRWTLAAAALVPLTVTFVPGTAGNILVAAVGLLTDAAGWVFYLVF